MDEGTKNYAPGHTFVGTNLSVLVDQTKSARDGLKTTHTDLDTRSTFFTPDFPIDEPIIVTDESEEEEAEKHKEAHDASHNKPKDTSTSRTLSPK
ncbi:hypothetical protein Tco_0307024 [Tanacetum coccineum]